MKIERERESKGMEDERTEGGRERGRDGERGERERGGAYSLISLCTEPLIIFRVQVVIWNLFLQTQT